MSNYTHLVLIFHYFLIAEAVSIASSFSCYVRMMDDFSTKKYIADIFQETLENAPSVIKVFFGNFIIFV